MKNVTREEIMTSPAPWNPSLLDDSRDAVEQRIKQFPSTPLSSTDNFYNIEGDLLAWKSDSDSKSSGDSVSSGVSIDSDGSLGHSYFSRSRKEKRKRRY